MLKINRLIAAAICLALVFSLTPLAKAQTANGVPSGSGLSISPTISEYTIKPGGSANVNITLKNITVDNVTAKGFVNDFTSDNNTGNPKIITDTTNVSPNSIRNFVFNLDDVALKRGEQKNIIIGLQVPASTPPGAYFGIIRYRAVPAGANAPGPGQVALTASVGTIVLITVPGNIREQVQFSALHIYRGANDGSLFFGSPDKIGVEVKNFGNGFVKPFGTVEVHNMFKKTVVSYQFNNPKQPGNILPNSERIFTNNIKGINRIGRYTAIASVSYGNGSQVLTQTKSFWYIPPAFGIGFLVILAVLVYLAWRAYSRYNRDRKHTRR
jgi:hypothetical protein